MVKKRPALQIRRVQGTGSTLDGLETKGATTHQRPCSLDDTLKKKGQGQF